MVYFSKNTWVVNLQRVSSFCTIQVLLSNPLFVGHAGLSVLNQINIWFPHFFVFRLMTTATSRTMTSFDPSARTPLLLSLPQSLLFFHLAKIPPSYFPYGTRVFFYRICLHAGVQQEKIFMRNISLKTTANSIVNYIKIINDICPMDFFVQFSILGPCPQSYIESS